MSDPNVTDKRHKAVLDYWDSVFEYTVPSIKTRVIPFKYSAITHNVLSETDIFSKNPILDEREYLVNIASGEQLFLYLFFACKFEFDMERFYKVRTVCNRPNDNNPPYSLPEFHKTEFFSRNDANNGFLYLKRFVDDLTCVAKDAFVAGGLISEKITTKLVHNERINFHLEEPKGKCEEVYQVDLMYNGNLELGSYGIRRHGMNDRYLSWTYATMLAEERFDAIYNYQIGKEAGYHVRDIPKGELGQASKITEEYLEFMDAVEQNNKILAVIELSDLIGAIDSYLKVNCGDVNLEDVMKMMQVTRRAFENGKR